MCCGFFVLLPILPVTPDPPSSKASPIFNAVVRGAGPTGALTALALADAGWSVSLIDPQSPSQIQERSRAYAFTHSSRRLLKRLGLWKNVSCILHPFDRLDLEDLGARELSRFGTRDLRNGSSEEHPVGWIGAHRELMGVLLEQLKARPSIRLHLGNSSPGSSLAGLEQEADWIIAADGALSPTREALGIPVWRHAYRQHCLTAQVRLRGAPSRTAWERLRPEGPFALLPMGGGRFQVVWSAPGWRCRQLESLSPAAFLDALAPVLPPGVDVEEMGEPPRVFPVGLLLARSLHRGKTILVGETAHRCHPVGGQGLNLCWRDVESLHQLALEVSDGKRPMHTLGPAYGRSRWLDVCLTLLITDSLVRIFSNRHPLLVPGRKLALRQLRRLPVLRRTLLGVMSHGACQRMGAAPT